MKKSIFFNLFTINLLLIVNMGCGGGGGGGNQPDASDFCPSNGFPLYCPIAQLCCPPGENYACKVIVGSELHGQKYDYIYRTVCSTNPCSIYSETVDYCE